MSHQPDMNPAEQCEASFAITAEEHPLIPAGELHDDHADDPEWWCRKYQKDNAKMMALLVQSGFTRSEIDGYLEGRTKITLEVKNPVDLVEVLDADAEEDAAWHIVALQEEIDRLVNENEDLRERMARYAIKIADMVTEDA